MTLRNTKNITWPCPLKLLRGLRRMAQVPVSMKTTFFSHQAKVNTGEDKRFFAMSQIRHIQGTCFFVPKDLIDDLLVDFNNTIEECLNDEFIGSDEKIFDLTYEKAPDRYHLIECGWREYFNIFKPNDPAKKNKVLLDLGHHQGQGLRRLIDELGVNDEWEVHSFEPNPLLVAHLSLENTLFSVDVNIHDSAVWTKDGEAVF